MRSAIVIAFAAALLLSVVYTTPTEAQNSEKLLQNWIATGKLTRRDGNILFMLARDNRIYRIDAANAQITLDRLPEEAVSLQVGDRIRTEGTQTAATEVRADQVLIYVTDRPLPPAAPGPLPQQQELPPSALPEPSVPAQPGAGPEAEAEVDLEPESPPLAVQHEAIWTNRGFISGISFRDNTFNLQTSKGTFTIEARAAFVSDGRRQLPLSDLSVGDAVRVYGDVTGLSRICAEQVVLLRLRPDIEGQLPVRPTAMRGKILSIDYPSFTFRMETDHLTVNVLVDDNTSVTMQGRILAFMDLRPGALVKVDGLGAPASGYVARNVVIVSMPPR